MKTMTTGLLAIALATGATAVLAQTKAPLSATYITREEVDLVLKAPGIDHTIKVMDIGGQHFTVGVIHRGATTPRPAASAAAPRAAGEAPCGVVEAAPAADLSSGLTHDKQTEGYYIIGGGGVVVTGGHIVNGHLNAPTSDVVTTLNGPSCSGLIGGGDVVKRAVKVGDIVIIPAGVPHGWAEIADHVDYLSFRPSGDLFTAGYEHPALKK